MLQDDILYVHNINTVIQNQSQIIFIPIRLSIYTFEMSTIN